MRELIILEIISIASLLFSILANVFNFTSLNNYFLIFIWTIIASGIYGVNSHKKSNKIFLLLLLLPVLIFRGTVSIYFHISLFVLLNIFLTTSLNKGNYSNHADSLRNSLFILAGVLAFSYIVDLLNLFFEFTVPFLSIYFISTIILIRNMRHLNLGMDKMIIKRSNRRYLAVIIAISSLVTIDKLRIIIFNFISKVLGSIYDFIINILLKIIYYPLSFIILALERFVNWLMSRLNPGNVEYEVDITTEAETIEGFEYIAKEVPIINISLKILITVIFIYLIYKLIRKTGERKRYHMDYTEEREFIIKGESKKVLRKLIRKPKDLKGQIRYYYLRYLVKLKKNNIHIEKSNTSMEINQKAKSKYSIETIDKIRDIYIKYRYGYEEGENSEVDEIKELYKKLK